MDLFWEKLSDKRFQQAIGFLYNLQYSGIKLGLKNIDKILDTIGNPHRNQTYIHVAGTNGKGSTVAILEAALLEAGYKVGTFTSPHLISFQERIRINQKLIPVSLIIKFIEQYKGSILEHQLTFFEAATALAFWYFNQEQPDYIILETGLGGRLDSTNVVHAPITAITSVDFDHTQYLGNTLSEIASEKAGIIHNQSRSYTCNTVPDVVERIKERCHQTNSFYFNTCELSDIALNKITMDNMLFSFHLKKPNLSFENLMTPLIGKAQLLNHQLALTLLLNEGLIPADEEFINRAFQRIIWPGRLQKISHDPTVILDVGHNPAGFKTSLETLSECVSGSIIAVCGIVNDKDPATIAGILEEYCDHIKLVSFESSRTLPSEVFYNHFGKKNIVSVEENTAWDVVGQLKRNISDKDVILVIGSHYLIGEFLAKELSHMKSDQIPPMYFPVF
ncbi:MAG: folylpolyglutamate synthase/dihydrofolate synthase family protein [Calditrichia bacterium]